MIKYSFSDIRASLALLSFVSCASLFTGCAVSYTPINTTANVANNLPSVTRAELRQSPKTKTDVLSIHIPYEKSVPDEENYVSRVINVESLYPSVILNIPSEISRRRADMSIEQQKLIQQKNFDSWTDDEKRASKSKYSTASYFNQNEQEIEKAMIRKGFNVLDRAKFEAKLRDLRDNSNDKQYDKKSAGYYVLKKKFDKQLEDGEIDSIEYMDRLSDIEAKSRRSSSGKKRKENEMVDISEIIRAAQGTADGIGPNNVKADFLLQINNIDVLDSFNHPLELYKFDETKDFLKKHSGLNLGTHAGEIPRSIPRPWFKAFFNAKLIDIKTGQIVWIGEHIAESKSANKNGITIDFNIERYVNNQNEVSTAIRNYNNKLQSKSTNLGTIYRELNTLYIKQTKSKEFSDENQKNRYLRTLNNSIFETEKEYRVARSELINMDKNKPSSLYVEWEYSYHVSKPIVQPLMITNSHDPKMLEQVESHKKDLVKEVISALVNTIKLKQKIIK